jgi:hypothetical protein
MKRFCDRVPGMLFRRVSWEALAMGLRAAEARALEPPDELWDDGGDEEPGGAEAEAEAEGRD